MAGAAEAGTSLAALAAGQASAMTWIGIALAASASAWSAWAAWTLASAGNALRPGASPRRFVDEGPFALSRNPISLGGVLLTLGLGLTIGLPIFGLAAALSLALAARLHIRREEAELRRAFGGWYSDYAVRVRRWI